MNEEKPYLLFAGATYYPAPGWQDLEGEFEDFEEAVKFGKEKANSYYGWWQIVDIRTRKIIAGEGSGHTGLWGQCSANPNKN